MPQLDSTWFLSQIFWLCLTFGALYLVVAKVLAPRLVDVAKRRSDKIEGYIKQAQKLNDEAAEVLRSYEASILDAKNKADDMAIRQKTELEDLIDKKQKEANEKIYKELEKTEKNIAKLKDQALLEVEKIAKNLSKDIIKKLDV